MVSVIVKRPVLPLCVVDGRSRNPLYYYYYYYICLSVCLPVCLPVCLFVCPLSAKIAYGCCFSGCTDMTVLAFGLSLTESVDTVQNTRAPAPVRQATDVTTVDATTDPTARYNNTPTRHARNAG